MARPVLIVDDEADLSELLAYNLWKAGYETRVARDGLEGLKAVDEYEPDILVLDLMMPGLSGQDVLARVRGNPATAALPVIVLTAKNDEVDELAGLAQGADDYVTKPFSLKVLEARIENVLRRAASAGQGDEMLSLGPISLNRETHEARIGDSPLTLTVTEFRLLSSLIQADGKVLSRQALISRAMGSGVTITERTIDVHITSIRKKLGPLAKHIKTVRGVGYRTDTKADTRPDTGTDPGTDAGTGTATGARAERSNLAPPA